jgi:uncharacterized membrane protein YfcA
MTMSHVVLTILAGAGAGVLGALLGIGGGVFLVPFLNLVVGLPVQSAFAVSLITVIATSSVTSSDHERLTLVNLRLGMVLEIFTTVGGLAGVLFVNRVSDEVLRSAFASTLALIAVVIISRLGRRNITTDISADVGLLGGRYFDPDTGRQVAYRLRRLPVAFGASALAGFVSNLGVGGGVLKVPALNTWCGVPIRVAAATSSLMIGATAVVGTINYFMRGQIVLYLAAASVLGVLPGSRLGLRIAAYAPASGLKLLLASVLLAVSIVYFVRSGV